MIEQTLQLLERTAVEQHGVITVAYSDGKDSRVVLDLCLRHFTRVEAFFMYAIPGLECVEEALDAVTRRTGIKIHQYPHWTLARNIKHGAWCDPSYRRDDIQEYKLADVYALALRDTKSRLLATGAKKSDSPWRRRFMSNAQVGVINPLAEWNKFDVLSYLQTRKIPVPPSSGHNATGIDNTPDSLLWLYDTHPRDFARYAEFFPYIEAVVWRRKFYGS